MFELFLTLTNDELLALHEQLALLQRQIAGRLEEAEHVPGPNYDRVVRAYSVLGKVTGPMREHLERIQQRPARPRRRR